jgi:hypothetical protein
MKQVIIELTRDVANPQPDRRSKDFWLRSTFPEGTRLMVTDLAESRQSDDVEAIMAEVQKKNDSKIEMVNKHGSTPLYGPIGQAILAGSKEVEPQGIREVIAVHPRGGFDGVSIAYDLVNELLKTARPQVYAAIDAVLDRWDVEN